MGHMETCGPLIIFTGVAEFVILLLGLGSEGYGVSVKKMCIRDSNKTGRCNFCCVCYI